MSSAPPNPRPQPPQQKRDLLYDCGGCGEEVPLRPGDKIECPHCNYPVLFKKRTRRIVEFQAR
ncbi:hypothetical protein ABKV19_004769 [Rosa sericea]|uniref:Putative RNA polymerase archaeal subunit P/eukaryotic subunit RPABC4 n=1 Tax=Rosa chinensis TaxID=74649 RepID=A0A2P6QCI9_ROSCH|nr:putative RNA polymerase archaeal subunit P/eukaryotic subunit RPABC4 [Rosa chinensis]